MTNLQEYVKKWSADHLVNPKHRLTIDRYYIKTSGFDQELYGSAMCIKCKIQYLSICINYDRNISPVDTFARIGIRIADDAHMANWICEKCDQTDKTVYHVST